MHIVSDFALLVFMMAVLFSIVGGKPDTVIKGSFDIVSAIIKGFFELARLICTAAISALRGGGYRADRRSPGSRNPYPPGRDSSGNRDHTPPSRGSSRDREPYRPSGW